jgi:polysaccharide biosynthesis transport protein
VSIRDLLRTLRRNLAIVLACLFLGASGGAYLAWRQPPSYTTQTRLFVSSNGSDSTDSLLQNSNLVLERVPSYVTLVTSPLVLGPVAQRLGRTESTDALAAHIQATNPLQTAVIDITVRDTTPRGAYELAVALDDVVGVMVQRVETSATGFVPVKVTVVSRPQVPGGPDLGPAAWRLGLGILLGLALGTAIAAGRELFDPRLKDPEQLRTKLGLPPLAVIAVGARPDRAPPPTDGAYWTSAASEGYRQLRTNLSVLVSSGGLRSILVVGPHAADGGPTVARNLAIALGLAKASVLLVEADLRHPRFAAAFGIDGAGTDGLSAVLTGEADLDAVIHPWRGGAVHVLPAGTLRAGSTELLAADVMDDVLGQLERRFDVVIVSAPPLLEIADAAELSSRVDGVVLAVRYRGTRWDAVWRAVQALHDVQARLLGAAVLCRSRTPGVAPRDALRVPVAASRWAGPNGPAAGPRVRAQDRDVRPPALARRPLRSVPDLPKPLALPGVERAAGPPARGVAAVNGGNRIVPRQAGDPDGAGTEPDEAGGDQAGGQA